MPRSLAIYLAAFAGWAASYFGYAAYSYHVLGSAHVADFGVFFWGGLYLSAVVWLAFGLIYSSKSDDATARRAAVASVFALWFLIGGCYTAVAAVIYAPLYLLAVAVGALAYVALQRLRGLTPPRPAAIVSRVALFALPPAIVFALIRVVPETSPAFAVRYLGGEAYTAAVAEVFERLEVGDDVERVRALLPSVARSHPGGSYSWAYGTDRADGSLGFLLRVEGGRVAEVTVTREPRGQENPMPTSVP